MEARLGDHVRTRPRNPGEHRRRGEIVDVRGTADTPLYIVRWSDGHESVCFPDSDVIVEHAHARDDPFPSAA
jgi:hypothetical protein